MGHGTGEKDACNLGIMLFLYVSEMMKSRRFSFRRARHIFQSCVNSLLLIKFGVIVSRLLTSLHDKFEYKLCKASNNVRGLEFRKNYGLYHRRVPLKVNLSIGRVGFSGGIMISEPLLRSRLSMSLGQENNLILYLSLSSLSHK
jgi:hypothetical protein